MYPILLDLGFWQLRSYGLVVAMAISIGVWWSAREGERRGFRRTTVFDFAWTVVIAGLIGARLHYVVFSKPATYLARPWDILAVWHGGLSFQGGLLAGLAAGVWFLRKQRLPVRRFGDAVIPGLILGQTVGQIACLLNGDTYGSPTALPWAIVFTHPEAMAPLGVPLHPVQVYELVGYGLVFLAVQRVAQSPAPAGSAAVTYAVLYGAVRFVVEFFRGDPPVLAGIIVPQALSVLLAFVGAVGLWLVQKRGSPGETATARR